MTQRFHVGDVVRIVEAGPSHGLTTTITKAECRWGDEWQYWGPCPTSPSQEGLWYDKHLEQIEEPTPKFKVGDRVRITVEHYAQGYVGMEAEVLGVLRHDVRLKPLSDRPRGFGRTAFCWPADQVEKVESVPFKLERGDKVVNRKTGRKGFVNLGMVHDEYDPTCLPVPAKALEEYEEHHPGTYDLIKKDAPW